MSKNMDEQLELAHKVVDIVDRPNKKIRETLLRCNMDNPESSYPQGQVFARKKGDERFQQI